MKLRAIGALAALVLLGACQHGAGRTHGRAATALEFLEGQLPARQTVAIGYIGNPSEKLGQTVKLFKDLSKPGDKQIEEMTKWLGSFGFDPTQTEGWRSIGVDIDAGIGIGFLLEPIRLVVALKAKDLEKLLPALDALIDKPVVTYSAPGKGQRQLLLDGKARANLYRQGDFILFVGAETPDKKGMEPGPWQGPAKADESIGASPLHRRLLPAQNPEALAFLYMEPIARKWEADTGLKKGELERYVRSLVWSYDSRGINGWRLLLGDKLQTGLAGIFGPSRPPSKAADRVLNPDHIQVRLRLDLSTLFDGLLALLPDFEDQKEAAKMAEARAKLGEAQGIAMVMGNTLGISWPDFSAGINGEILLSYPKASLSTDWKKIRPSDLLLILGADSAKASAKVFGALSGFLISKGATELQIEGQRALRLPLPRPIPGLSPTAIQVQDSIVIGASEEAVASFLKTSPTRKGQSGLKKATVVYGLDADLKDFAKRLIPKLEAQLKAATKAVQDLANTIDGAEKSQATEKAVEKPSGPSEIQTLLLPYADLSTALHLNEDELYSMRQGVNLPIVPLLAAIGIPNFIQQQCKAKQAEAKSNLRLIHRAQAHYDAEFDQWGSWDQIGVLENIEANRYTYCSGPVEGDDPGGPAPASKDWQCIPCKGPQCKGVTPERAKAACAAQDAHIDPGKTFIACAVANLNSSPEDLDVWITTHTGAVYHPVKDCGAKVSSPLRPVRLTPALKAKRKSDCLEQQSKVKADLSQLAELQEAYRKEHDDYASLRQLNLKPTTRAPYYFCIEANDCMHCNEKGCSFKNAPPSDVHVVWERGGSTPGWSHGTCVAQGAKVSPAGSKDDHFKACAVGHADPDWRYDLWTISSSKPSPSHWRDDCQSQEE